MSAEQEKNNEPKEKPVSDFLDNNHHFWIPSYQRGYRWDSKQVEDLLEDLYQFANDENPENKKYFLQPIVVKKNDDGWEVLDGQQRLTTMLLILKEFINGGYMVNAEASLFSSLLYTIKYRSRPELNFDAPNPTDNIDSYYLANAKQTIEDWMENKRKEKKFNKIAKIKDCLFAEENEKKAYFIWYQVPETSDDESSIKVFNRLNKGKIPLTSSELIKALFIMYCNHNKENKTEIDVIQQEEQFIMEWAEMDRKFQDDKFWNFLSNEEKQTRLDLLFDFVTEKKPEADSDYSYRMFQNLFDYSLNPNSTELEGIWKNKDNKQDNKNITSMEKAWEKVKATFNKLLSWYESNIYFHYVGFLVTQNERLLDIHIYIEQKKEQEKTNKEWTEEDTKRILHKLIREKLPNNGKKIDIDELEYKDALTKKLLLLFNIETCIKTENQRFDFEKFKNESWDVEHIDSRNDSSLQQFDERITWMKNIEKCLEIEIKANNSRKDESLKEECSNLIKEFEENQSVVKDKYSDFYKKVNKHFSSDNNKDVNKDSINNLTLLNSSTNREYKDAPFMFKRQTIIEKDKEGKCFLPICTRNCFLKYYTDSENDISQLDAMRWNKTDKDNYLAALHKVLDPIITTEDKGIAK